LLSGMARLFEQDGFHLLGAHEVAPEILVPEGRLGRVAPSPRDRDDFDIGFACLRAIGPFDIGQAVVVSGKHVLAVEAAEGTDLMLARVAELRANGRVPTASDKGVLVKAAKATQDRRFDLPSIGPKTVEGIVRAGLGGIAVIAGETIIAEPPGVVAAADGANVFVVGIRSGTPA
jgi:UDP-2,3-diacylglucosamine hydrolase